MGVLCEGKFVQIVTYVCILHDYFTKFIILISRVNKKEKSTKVTRHTLYSCYDNTLSLASAEHVQVYFVLCKQCLRTGILELDTLFSFLSTLANIRMHFFCKD